MEGRFGDKIGSASLLAHLASQFGQQIAQISKPSS